MVSTYTIRKYSLVPVMVLMVALVAVLCGDSLAGENGGIRFTQGLRSIQFGIERDLQLGAFDGLLLSYKKHISPNIAYRFGVTLNASAQNGGQLPAKRFTLGPRERRNARSNYDGNWTDMEVHLMRVRYFSSDERVRPFWGLGPTVRYYRYDFEGYGKFMDDPYTTRVEWDYSYLLSGGIAGVFGVEYFAWKRISFIAEYRSSLTYSYWSEEYRVADSNQSYLHEISRQFNFLSQSVSFGIAVYL